MKVMPWIVERTGNAAPGNGGHYTGSVQPIDLIDSLTVEQLIGAHEAAVIKYVSRWRAKGGKEDLLKAQWWLGRLVALADDIVSPGPERENGK